MSEWREEAIVLATRPYGESAAILEVFTRDQGRHAGVVRGGGSRRMAPHLQPGAQVQAVWKARLGAQLGSFTIEPLRSRGHLYTDREALAGLSAICALLSHVLPERVPHPGIWPATVSLLDRLSEPGWPEAYLRWEIRLLEETGYGLDLSRCAVTGLREGLVFLSPKTGRAVTLAGAGDWADRLLPIPAALAAGWQQGEAGGDPGPLTLRPDEVVQALAATGHFLAREFTQAGPSGGMGPGRQAHSAGSALETARETAFSTAPGGTPGSGRPMRGLPEARARLIGLLERALPL